MTNPNQEAHDVRFLGAFLGGGWVLGRILRMLRNVGVPYGSRTLVAAVKENGFIVIQGNFAAWIVLYRTSMTHGNAYWTLNGRAWAWWGFSSAFSS